jgi:hypothetical protein
MGRDSAASDARFDGMSLLKDENPAGCCSWQQFARQLELFKNGIQNNILEKKLDHICVLFVQHPLEKGLSHAFRSGSFVACAEVLGNCDLATEGGIPRSSR